jgi:hypothetical protein
MKIIASAVAVLGLLPAPAMAQVRLPPPTDVPRWVPQPAAPNNPNLLPVPEPPPMGRGSNRYLPPPPSYAPVPGSEAPFVPPNVSAPAPPRSYRAPAPYMPADCRGLDSAYGVSIRGGYACLTRPAAVTYPGGTYRTGARGCQNYPGSRRVRIRGGFACF